ncbi:MAG TPA: hypothetical protein VK966_01290, partial [Longimicrobiales bacterium]|nr:hypothetical protein [Longimicrobiales bacterium]
MNAGPDWRLLVSARMGAIPENADGATNMATDAAILGAVCDGAGPTLRFYRWTRPTLSFGRNQPAAGR